MQPKDDLPEGLKKFTNRHGFFRLGSKDMDSVIIQTIGVYCMCESVITICRKPVTNKLCVAISVCFRELCGLCWMLHVRDQLTVSCRRYQATRNMTKGSQVNKILTE